MVRTIVEDARYTLRNLTKHPGTVFTVVLSLAVGLGANATVFSIVNALLFRPLPLARPSELVEVWTRNLHGGGPVEGLSAVSYPDFDYYARNNRLFTGFAAATGEASKVSWIRNGQGEQADAQLVSDNFFQVAGLRPASGRFFSANYEPPCAVLGYTAWQRLGANPDVIGSAWNVNGKPMRIVGVAPKGFNGLLPGVDVDLWVPLRDMAQVNAALERNNRQMYWLVGMGRLKPGVTLTQAQVGMRVLSEQIAAAHPDTNRDLRAATYSAQLIPGPFRKYVLAFGALLLSAMTLVLLVGCGNAANILLAQAAGRSREIAIRAALGAGRLRLIAHVLNESAILGLLSGVAGYAAAFAVAPLLLGLRPANLLIDLDPTPDWRVGLFCLGASLIAGIVFGIVPALRGARLDLAETMKTGATNILAGRSRFRTALIVVQVALCMLLLVGGALCVQSLHAARVANPGFHPDKVFVSSVSVEPFGYDQERGERLFHQLIDRVAATPGVESVSTTDHVQLTAYEMGLGIKVPGVPPPPGTGSWPIEGMRVSPGYFRTLQTRLLQGREFTWNDRPVGLQVAIINEAAARRFFPNQSAVGKHVELEEDGGTHAAEIVGVVETGKYRSLGENPKPFLYRPLTQMYSASQVFLVRTSADPVSFTEVFRKQLQSLDPRLAPFESGAMRRELELALFTARATGTLLGTAGVLGLALALVGIYGVIAYVIAQRRHEIGIRMALGATRTGILAMMMRYSLTLTVAGIAIGAVLALLGGRVIANFLYGVHPVDLLTYGAVACGLILLSAVATLLPSRAAVTVDPSEALRYE